MKIKIIYEDKNLLVVNKPAGIIVFPEKEEKEKTLIEYLLEKFPDLKKVGKGLRYGVIHRLDKDTSGILLIAKNNQSLIFFQEQFKKNKVKKKYLALVIGNPKNAKGRIETLIGRSLKNKIKQKVYFFGEPRAEGKRKAITEYRVLKNFSKFSLVEVKPFTGRKHQIRTHLAFLGHPIVGDKLYGFKKQIYPQGLTRQFLHASYLKIKMPQGKEMEFNQELPEDLMQVLKNLEN